MKKILFALTAIAAFTGSASAADLGARPYTKAPPPIMAPIYNWTGFYIFGGGGGGIWDAKSDVESFPGGAAFSRDIRSGGDGFFGTVGAGFDWQFNSSWVGGIFADGQFGNLRGSIIRPVAAVGTFEGTEKLNTSWAVGARLGYLVAPNVLSYVNGGYSGSEWSGATYSGVGLAGVPTFTTASFDRNGWFIGGGVENSLNFFGITAPGWFMKTEYRSAFYDRATLPETFLPAFGGGPTGFATTFKPIVQTVSTSIVYRFNWGGPAGARY
jgi:outer membrane immunogenic protein